MSLRVALKILDPRLPGWGFPRYGSSLAAGLDLHACIDEPLVLQPQAPAVLISAGIAFCIDNPQWCALVLPRSGLGHREGLVLGNAVGVIDADYQGTCFISAWNRNAPRGETERKGIVIRPGDRIAPLVFTRIAHPEFSIVEELSDARSRQDGGFGSTGIAATCPNWAAGRHSDS
ncbi:MAG TPA: dUTP diphosphatase [Stellaceae bacterium]|jgi:dUTP pyrophosphatase|nr:dUTP diphosphatase [Stellaceae bacterium]